MKPPTRLDWIIVGSVVLALSLAAFLFLPLPLVTVLVYCLAGGTVLFAVIAVVLFSLATLRRRSR
jgi:uncharacterized membrane protein